ncbi:MAG: hypothetical protein KGQ59_06060 [Bdellovibrionales bacterium]|nr:hypothetical protein [Bdellovibrionales bacterium]
MKRGTWSFQQQWKEWGVGLGLLVGLTASADMGPICVNCQLPSSSAVEALGLSNQIPGLGVEFGTTRAGYGLVSTQPVLQFPNLLAASGGSNPPPTPSWLDRVQPGFLPQNFSLSPAPWVSPDSFVWNWNAYPDGFHPQAAFMSLWNTPTSPWAASAQMLSAGSRVFQPVGPAMAALSASSAR